MTKVLICGDRNWNDYNFIRDTLIKYRDDHTIDSIDFVIEGEAEGADKLGRQAAEWLGIIVLKYPADWTKYGRAAGPIRNKEMLVDGRPDEVWAFHDHISKSKGTMNMIRLARAKGVPVHLYSHFIGIGHFVDVIVPG